MSPAVFYRLLQSSGRRWIDGMRCSRSYKSGRAYLENAGGGGGTRYLLSAANVVVLSPSAVSMQIRALEQHLAAELFDRSRRPPVLNEALLPTARNIIGLHDSLRDDAASPNEFVGRLRLGVIPTALSSFAPVALAVLTEFYRHRDEYPLFKLLNNEELDATIIGEPPSLPGGLLWRPFVKEAICAIAPSDATGATAGELLRTHPYIKLVRGAWQLRMIEGQIAAVEISLHAIMQLDSIEAVTLMVHHGLGVSIVPRRSVEVLLRLPMKIVPFGAVSDVGTGADKRQPEKSSL